MTDSEANEFMTVTRALVDNYGRRPMLPETVAMWFQIFKPYSMQQYRMACQHHLLECPAELPTAGLLIERIRGKKNADRPGAEEAWSIAVKACDEEETVMMTDEIAEAWGVARPIFDLGDEVGARMAFKEVYGRLLGEAQAPARWFPSIGTDPHKRDTALKEAKRQGLLAAPTAKALALPDETDKGEPDAGGVKRFKEAMAQLKFANADRAAERAAEAERERMAVLQRKEEIAATVAQYKGEGK